ncbi:MAG: hypothetical protein JSW00_09985 [Thermoplasmata archaeon]|nr:MAG: hypothetical protein JSW00_09985 [Thermoplasmata archaeon]
MSQILQKLKGGDLRSIGRADEVVEDILKNPSLFGEVFKGMSHDDPKVRMRSADALEKVSSKHPEYLQPYKKRLISEVSVSDQQEVQWHVAQMFSYLKLTRKEREKVVSILFSYIDGTKSNIVKVFSMETLTELAESDDNLKPRVIGKIKKEIKSGSSAVVNRGRKLIKLLE